MYRKEMIAGILEGKDPLELSIEAWEEKRRALPSNFVEMSGSNCALCYVSKILCPTCVIANHTKEILCRGTPHRDCVIEPTKYNAGRMIAFLKSPRED